MSQLAQIDMTPEETVVLEREATRLARLLSASEKFTAEAANPPVPGSRMGHARTVDLRDAYDIAALLILACEDHLRTALLVLKTGPLPSFALYTLLRAAADAIVRAKHLLDPAISEQTRLARGMNERLDNINQLSKAMAAPGRAHYDQRVQHLEHRALANGISVLREKRKDGTVGKVIGFGEPWSKDVDLFSRYLPAGSIAFRFLSGYVHSKPWVLAPGYKAQPSSEPKVGIVPTDMDVGMFVAVLTTVLDLHDASVGHWLTLAGYPAEVWANAKQGGGSGT
jgi:hypothetical protein